MSNILSTNTDEEALKAAFAHFNQVSDELIKAYQLLELKAEKLGVELQKANDELVSKSKTNAELAQKLSTVLDAMPAAVIEIDAAEKIVSMNRSASAILPATTTTGDFLDLSFAGEMANDATLQLTTTNGQVRYFSQQCCELSMGHRLLLLFDITMIKDLSEQLAHRKKLAAMGEMTASLAHQLRTPLSTALLYTKNLEKENLSPDDRKKFTGKIVNRLKALESLVQSMLTFVRQEREQPVSARIQIEDLKSEIEQIFQPQCELKQVNLNVEIKHHNQQSFSVPQKISPILLNLVENAVIHSPNAQAIDIYLLKEGVDFIAEVHDKGPGVPAEHLDRIFEPFFTTRASGTGLGLSMASMMAEELGGKLTYNRRDDTTVFSITIPEKE